MDNGDQQTAPNYSIFYNEYDQETNQEPHGGLTKREYFAAMAMQGMIYRGKESTFSLPMTQQYIAKCAVDQADALLKVLDK